MAIGADTFSGFGGAVKDIFAGFGAQTSAEGKLLEAGMYDRAAGFAGDNATFTRTTTAVKEYQANRAIEKNVGEAEATIADHGFTESGSALDILSESMREGAMQKALLTQQGAITEESYNVQQKAYQDMAASSRLAADALGTQAIGDFIGGGIKAISGAATFFT